MLKLQKIGVDDCSLVNHWPPVNSVDTENLHYHELLKEDYFKELYRKDINFYRVIVVKYLSMVC